MEAQGQHAHPIQNRETAHRPSRILLTLVILAACQASEALRVLPDEASTAMSGGMLTAPTNLTATPLTFSQVRLTWSDASPNESGFQVFRSAAAGGGFTLVTTTGPSVASWTDTGLTGSTQYCYQVRAVRENGSNQVYSSFSAASCGTTAPPPPPPPPPPPGAPDQIYAEPFDSVTMRVTWRDGSWNEDGFRVERSIDLGATWTAAGTVAANVQSFAQPDALAEQQGRCYRVIAFNVAGESPPNGMDCAVPPAAPTNFALTVTAPGEIELSWTDNSAAELWYQVWVAYWDPFFVNWYEDQIAVLPANSTRYRTALASSEFRTLLVYVSASTGWSARATPYLAVPPQP